jgi:hypothetical protein
MQAIHTKYLTATNTKPSRIKAYTHAGLSAVISYPHEFDGHNAHYQAVKELAKKHALTWDIDRMTWGDSADGRGYVFCFSNSKVTT